MQLPLFKPRSDWVPTPVAQLPSWEGAKRVAVDIETHDPDLKTLGPGVRRNGFIVGVSFAIEDGPAHYLPLRHSEDNLPLDAAMSYLTDQAKAFKGDIAGANLSYDLDYLTEAGILFPNVGYFRDVQLADPLIYELHESYSLENIALRYGFSGKDETLLRQAAIMYDIKNPKQAMRVLPGRYVAPYAIEDVRLPLQILRKQERLIDEKELWQVYNVESKLLPVLVKMRCRGVLVSEERLEGVEQWALGEETKALGIVKHQTGISIPVGGVWQAKMLEQVLVFLGVKVGRTSKGAPNIDKFVLDKIDHPVAEALLWARKVNKLRTTFAKSIRTHMVRGRIHCIMNQMAREDDDNSGVKGGRFGRMSSEHPNLQQQPSRDTFAKKWRSIYLPNPGGLWGTADYSQQEPRMTTHFAVKARCSRAQVAADRYRNDPLTDNHQMMADLTGLPRKQAKDIYLGLCYGMGGAKLADSLGLPTEVVEHKKSKKLIRVAGEEAQAILDRFNSEAPFIREISKKCESVAKARGYIKTILGRRCHFPQDAEGNFDWTHKALNRLIQGSSADQTKAAMVEADKARIYLQLQVHDEIDATLTDRTEGEKLSEIMKTVIPLEVPSRVDLEIGPSWGEAE